MMRMTARALALAAPLMLFFPAAAAQEGFLGFGGSDRNPSLTIAPADIKLDVPMPVNSANLALLLAQAGEGVSLSSIKEAALRNYRQHLQSELQARLWEFFGDEEIPLVKREGLLSLHNSLDITVIKHLSGMESEDGYDLERGTVEVSGGFRYQLRGFSGRELRARSLDIGELEIREEYRVKSPQSGGAAEDNTEEAIKLALSAMVEEIFEEIEDDLEAGELRDLLRG